MDDLWAKTERAMAEGRHDRAKELVAEGKKLSKQRMKVLKLADKDGWGTAFEYLSDDLADDENDRKRMKKAKKAAEAKGKEKERRTRYTTEKGYERHATSSTQSASTRKDPRTCWTCGKFGHKANTCPRNLYKRH